MMRERWPATQRDLSSVDRRVSSMIRGTPRWKQVVQQFVDLAPGLLAVTTPISDPPIPAMCQAFQLRPSRRRSGGRAAAQPARPSSRVGGVAISNSVIPGWLAGPATSYELKQRVAGSIDNFWSFPHSQLYAEPARLVEAGLVTADREHGGRRRRTYTISPAGRDALREWLAVHEPAGVEIRDPGLLKLFLAGAGTPEDVGALAAEQPGHQERLDAYRELDTALEQAGDDSSRRETLRFGLAVEEAYVEFWSRLERQGT